jgi:hypothetical protein
MQARKRKMEEEKPSASPFYLVPLSPKNPEFVSAEVDLVKHYKLLDGKEYTPKIRKALSKSFLDLIHPGLLVNLKVIAMVRFSDSEG